MSQLSCREVTGSNPFPADTSAISISDCGRSILEELLLGYQPIADINPLTAIYTTVLYYKTEMVPVYQRITTKLLDRLI